MHRLYVNLTGTESNEENKMVQKFSTDHYIGQEKGTLISIFVYDNTIDSTHVIESSPVHPNAWKKRKTPRNFPTEVKKLHLGK
jgi:hypothetical protein